MKIYWHRLFFVLLMLPLFVAAQQPLEVKLTWTQPASLVMGEQTGIYTLSFEGAQYPDLPEQILPSFIKNIAVPDGMQLVEMQLDSLSYAPLTEQDKQLIGSVVLPEAPVLNYEVLLERGKPIALIRLLPFGVNPKSGVVEKLVSFTLKMIVEPAPKTPKQAKNYQFNSVLAMGEWYKLYIGESGIYKVTYEDMKSLGINMNGLHPDKIRIFGNGGAMLSTIVGEEPADDLNESALKVVTANPGVFAPGDYVLFYGQGTLTWDKNPLTNRIEHTTHLYADEAVYFISTSFGTGRRIAAGDIPQGQPDYFTNEYTALYVYEKDLTNLIKSGRKWFDVKMDNYNRTLTIPRLNFPDLKMGEPVSIRYGMAARSTNSTTSFNLLLNNQIIKTIPLQATTGDYGYAADLITFSSFTASSEQMDFKVQFNPSSGTDLGWFDFLALNAQCNLKFRDGQMSFRDIKTVGESRITEFTLSNAAGVTEVWDVSDPLNVSRVSITKSGSDVVFQTKTEKLKEFVAIDGTNFKSVRPGERVANQNLHSIGSYDMVIVTHPLFMDAARRLGIAHNNMGEISVVVVPLPEIYNEFSSGIQDISAIRNFMKMLYDRGTNTGSPRYLLLFGNASYDLKSRVSGTANFVPTFHNENSVNPPYSFLSDDFFGLLDDGEGGLNVQGKLDVATGRIPVRTVEQANEMVDKVIAYMHNEEPYHGDWRNTMLVVADDSDRNTHLEQAEALVDRILENHPAYNIEKLYFDAYKIMSTPGGSLFPDLNRELVSKVEKGAMLVNYIGHGGVVGWGHERVLEIPDINSWTNYERMGMFFTATCEFSRFDDPSKVSAGELVFLNPEGGALSMITTTRLAYASENAKLNLSFADTAFNSEAGNIPRLGDVLKYTKNDNVSNGNTRHLTLFGDPSLRMVMPEHKVHTTSITNAITGAPVDTLFANSMVTIAGEVKNVNGQLLSSFNGEVQIKVFDKPSKVRTLGQAGTSRIVDFIVQKNILYQGKATVENGVFSFTFPVPRDIDYSFGKGKLSYYATNGTEDANGYSTDLIIGGFKELNQQDYTGPEIKLFMNDTNFVDGGLVSEFPKLLAFLYDESGINTVGNGVGHDIVATIDNDSYSSVVLNEYYSSNRDSFQSGSLLYHYYNLPDGEHTLTLKAWDVFNNSSTATITFVVQRDIILTLDEVVAYPNPTAGDVTIKFGHNLFDARFDIEMSVFNTSGMMVRTTGPMKVESQGYESGLLYWDGCDDTGNRVRAGLYLVRLMVRSKYGGATSITAKVIVAR